MNDYRVFGTVIAIVLLFMGFWNRRLAGSSQWPTTSGNVLSSTIQFGDGGGGSGEVYWLKVDYEYRVNATLFTGGSLEQMHPVVRSQSRDKVAAEKANWPPGKTITVYYDPDNPGRSVLIPGKKLWATWLLWSVAVMLLVATWSVHVVSRLRRRYPSGVPG